MVGWKSGSKQAPSDADVICFRTLLRCEPEMGFCRSLMLAVCVVGGVAAPVCQTQAEERIEYNRDIRPILAEKCFACHGPDSAARQADLRLDRRAMAVEQLAIVPGQPETSEAIRRIYTDNPEEIMPPRASHKDL